MKKKSKYSQARAINSFWVWMRPKGETDDRAKETREDGKKDRQ